MSAEREVNKMIAKNPSKLQEVIRLKNQLKALMDKRGKQISIAALESDEALKKLSLELYNEIDEDLRSQIRPEYMVNFVLSQKKRIIKKQKKTKKSLR